MSPALHATPQSSRILRDQRPKTRCHGRMAVVCRTTVDRVSSASPELQSVLQAFDADGDGRLTYAEAQQAIQAWQARLPSTNGTSPPHVTPSSSVQPAAAPSKTPGPVSWELQVVNGQRAARARGVNPLAALLSYVADNLSNKGKTRASASDLVWSFLGMFAGVAALGVINLHVRSWPVVGQWHQQGLGLLLGSFGTLCVLIFGRPESEAIRLWNLLAGHLVATAIVLSLLHVMGPSVLSRALAMGAMIAAMMATDCVHPPGGALVLMAVDSAAIQRIDWWFMLYPSLAYTLAVLLPIGVAVNWLKRNVKFDFPAVPAPSPAPSEVSAAFQLKPKTA